MFFSQAKALSLATQLDHFRDLSLALCDEADQVWLDPVGWSRSSITNTMCCGFVSSDRAIVDYALRIR